MSITIDAAQGRLTAQDLPLQVEFGARYSFVAWIFLLIPVALGATRLDVAPTYERVLLAILVAVDVAIFLSWLIPVLRDTARGRLRISVAKIEIFGRHRYVEIDLAQCSDFTLSKTRNRITCETTSKPGGESCSFDHLRLSRQQLTTLTGLLNELAGAARGDVASLEIKVPPQGNLPRPPSHLNGPRLGPDGLLRYGIRTGYMVCATLLVCAVLCLPLAAMSVQCQQPVTTACAKVAPIVFAAFLLMIPIVPAIVYFWRRYRGAAHRLRDLDVLPTRAAVWLAMIPFSPARNRLVAEYGSPGTNRFGPPTA